MQEVEQNVLALEGAEAFDEAYRCSLAAKMASTELPGEDFCTGCGYCAACPNGFDPTRFMQAMRDYGIYGRGMRLAEWLRERYVGQDAEAILDLCVACGWCEEQCPQHLEIIEQIRRAKEALTEGGWTA